MRALSESKPAEKRKWSRQSRTEKVIKFNRKPNSEFFLGWMPGEWRYYPELGEILPELTQLPIQRGVNGYNPIKQDTDIQRLALNYEKIGWTLIDELDLNGLEGYEDGFIDTVDCEYRVSGTVLAGIFKHARWMKPLLGTDKMETDLKEYKRVVDFLLDSGVIEFASRFEIEARKAKLVRKIDNFKTKTSDLKHPTILRYKEEIKKLDEYLNFKPKSEKH